MIYLNCEDKQDTFARSANFIIENLENNNQLDNNVINLKKLQSSYHPDQSKFVNHSVSLSNSLIDKCSFCDLANNIGMFSKINMLSNKQKISFFFKLYFSGNTSYVRLFFKTNLYWGFIMMNLLMFCLLIGLIYVCFGPISNGLFRLLYQILSFSVFCIINLIYLFPLLYGLTIFSLLLDGLFLWLVANQNQFNDKNKFSSNHPFTTGLCFRTFYITLLFQMIVFYLFVYNPYLSISLRIFLALFLIIVIKAFNLIQIINYYINTTHYKNKMPQK